jgi:hypothetical protein
MKNFWLAGLLFMSAAALPGAAQQTKKEKSNTHIEKIKFNGHAAWRLSDGQSEAIVVPDFGRVMRFGRVGGMNWLWNAPQGKVTMNNWKNYGGDKTWPAPQTQWPGMAGKSWPPPPAWDGMPHKAGVKNGKLWMVGPVQKPLGVRVVREFWFDTNGDFVVSQAADKKEGDPTYISLWSVIQVIPPEAIFLPLNPSSPYKNNFYWIYKPKAEVEANLISPGLLRVVPSAGDDKNNFKIGTDANVPAAIAVRDGWAFMARSARPAGDYPDGALNAGFPVELWNMGPTDVHYNELELLSPLQLYKVGTRWRHTIRWSVHQLPTKDTNSPAMHAAIEKLFSTE